MRFAISVLFVVLVAVMDTPIAVANDEGSGVDISTVISWAFLDDQASNQIDYEARSDWPEVRFRFSHDSNQEILAQINHTIFDFGQTALRSNRRQLSRRLDELSEKIGEQSRTLAIVDAYYAAWQEGKLLSELNPLLAQVIDPNVKELVRLERDVTELSMDRHLLRLSRLVGRPVYPVAEELSLADHPFQSFTLSDLKQWFDHGVQNHPRYVNSLVTQEFINVNNEIARRSTLPKVEVELRGHWRNEGDGWTGDDQRYMIGIDAISYFFGLVEVNPTIEHVIGGDGSPNTSLTIYSNLLKHRPSNALPNVNVASPDETRDALWDDLLLAFREYQLAKRQLDRLSESRRLAWDVWQTSRDGEATMRYVQRRKDELEHLVRVHTLALVMDLTANGHITILTREGESE